jgi:hypothetical protein
MDARLAADVKRFQIIYKKNNTLHVKLVAREENRPSVESILTQTIKKNFGDGMAVRYEYADDIAPQISGKYQMVIIEK